MKVPEESDVAIEDEPSSEPEGVEGSSESPEPEEAVESPSLAEQITDDNVDEVLSNPAVQAHLERERAEAVNRAKQQEIAETRRQYSDPAVVRQAALGILADSGVDGGNLTQSAETKLNTLISSSRAATAEALATQYTSFLAGEYEVPGDLVSAAHERIQAKDLDGGLRTVVDGAVAAAEARLKADFDARVDDEVDKRVKQELEAAGESGPLNLPSTTKGSRANNSAVSLTTAEISALPYAAWKSLSPDIQGQIQANAEQADRERGAETVDVSRVQRVVGLAG